MPTPSPQASWHAKTPEQAASELQSDLEQGLSDQEAVKRLAIHGPNRLAPEPSRAAWLRLLDQFTQPLVLLLVASGAVTAFMGESLDAMVIFGVVLVNAVLGFAQEAKAVAAIEALSKQLSVRARVVRQGRELEIDAESVVPGDVLLVASGDRAAADARLAWVKNLRVDESALTGESLPVEKDVSPLEEAVGLADRSCMLHASSLVSFGAARALVTETGRHTQVGRIEGLINEVTSVQTPLTREIARLSVRLLWVILGLTALTFAVGLWRGQPPAYLFKACVALAVGAIPEGLPAAVTIILAIGVSRMARRGAVIRQLAAVETLGSTTVICTDKTGTLTENQMTVRRLAVAGRDFTVSGAGYAAAGAVLDEAGAALPEVPLVLTELMRAGVLCSDARLAQENGETVLQGDPTELALLVLAVKAGMSPEDQRREFPRLDVIPFESEHQYMACLHPSGQGGAVAYMKGAVERVLPRCQTAMDENGRPGPLDAAQAEREALRLAGQGLRVLALAVKTFEAGPEDFDHHHMEDGLCLIGLLAMLDPPRAAARDAVAACRKAGIRVKMITGDHARTAAAIAVEIGIGEPGPDGRPPSLTGRELAGISEADLAPQVAAVDVFARVSPEQKLTLVRSLQAQGQVVAMTGDGVNDAPALKQADIGVAMGKAGTEVARAASAMVLTDDNFATIVAAVEEGRAVFDNLSKFLVWTLPINLGLGFVIMAAILSGEELPIRPVQILWINMTTVILLGATLSFEPKEATVMGRAPREPGTPVFGTVMLARIVLVGLVLLAGAFGLYHYELAQAVHLPPEEAAARAETVAVNVFVLVGVGYLFSCRSLRHGLARTRLFTNPMLWAGVAAMMGLQLAFTYLPFMNRLFGSVPVPAESWLGCLGVALAGMVLVGLHKLAARAAR